MDYFFMLMISLIVFYWLMFVLMLRGEGTDLPEEETRNKTISSLSAYENYINNELMVKIYNSLLLDSKFAYEIAEELNITIQKASAILRLMCDNKEIYYYETRVLSGTHKGQILKKYFI